ncbi:uncharacterized protein LOC143041666 [Oratosquilla oratoria]|uniref:uncharacterized protein LOC143041666 n=1 Tax=Oratosquilla oratoria TaxID=337810 RepID=UPI003F76C072
MVDFSTRYCVASAITNKSAKTVVGSVFRNWISLFGAPRKILSDYGLESKNSDTRELGDLFGVRNLTTAAKSPWSNDTYERLNAMIGDAVHKVFEGMKCDINVAFAWAVSAHNALANNPGLSPNQLVFGFNPTVPFVAISSLSEGDDSGEVQEVQQRRNYIVSNTELPENSRRETRSFKLLVGQRIRGLNEKTGEHMSGRIVSRESVHYLVDNKSLVEALNSPHSVKNRHLHIDIALLKDMLLRFLDRNLGATCQRLRVVLSGQ